MLLAAGALSAAEITEFLLALGVLLGAARLLGEVARRFRQPAVLGEIVAGLLLGKTVLGQVAPEAAAWLFDAQGASGVALQGFTTLAVTLLLLVAGLEVDLSIVWRQGKAALSVSLTGLVFPFAVGFGLAYLLPEMLGKEPGGELLPFALFVGVAMAITALPVIAKILMDLNIFKSDIGMLIMSAAMVDDLLGWMCFAVVLALMGGATGDAGGGALGVGETLGGTLLFVGLMLTLGRWLVHRSLPFVQAHSQWPGGVMGFVLVVALLCAAFTEWVGVHAIFGAFIAGVAIGDSSHLRERTRDIIHQFVTNIFAPVFFASIGLQLDFFASFDVPLVLTVLVIAVFVKVGGCYLGASLAGLSRRESLAIGFAMSARGAMEIVLGQLALQAGLIRERLFVAIVVMALVTSLMSGPIMERLLKRKKPQRLGDLLGDRHYLPALAATTAGEAIRELGERAAALLKLDAGAVTAAVLERESLMSTGLADGLAVPHARLAMDRSLVVIGRSERGIDFNSPDGRPARLVFLLLSPKDDATAQIELLSTIARTFGAEEVRRTAFEARTYTQLRAAINAAPEGQGHGH